MRLWHKDLIKVLPRKQLVAQWRECCAIAGEINKYGSPRSPLTRKIMDYPIEHFQRYAYEVYLEMAHRDYKCDIWKFNYRNKNGVQFVGMPSHNELFQNWHTRRYLTQCYFNLQEKYDCGSITQEEWKKIHRVVHGIPREDFWYVCEENDLKND